MWPIGALGGDANGEVLAFICVEGGEPSSIVPMARSFAALAAPSGASDPELFNASIECSIAAEDGGDCVRVTNEDDSG